MHPIYPFLPVMAALALTSCSGDSLPLPVEHPVVNAVNMSVATNNRAQRPNLPYVSVTVCAPGTQDCQKIDNVLVDTGSVGLRLLSSALTVRLPIVNAASGTPLAECSQSAQGYDWGAVETADLRMGDELATALPIQVIGAGSVATAPDLCSSNGGAVDDNPANLGANGVLGIGPFKQDCGVACADHAASPAYYACAGAQCAPTQVALGQQVTQPVSRFDIDNNGTLLVVPSPPSDARKSVAGQLIFGIGTRVNNALNGAQVIRFSPGGTFTATYDAIRSPYSFLDSGANAVYFTDPSITQCNSQPGSRFYCPEQTVHMAARFTGADHLSGNARFDVGNAVNTGLDLPALAGPGSPHGFSLGMPFFFGRRIFTAIEDSATPSGKGPYMAFTHS